MFKITFHAPCDAHHVVKNGQEPLTHSLTFPEREKTHSFWLQKQTVMCVLHLNSGVGVYVYI